jgi:uncharacterized membrane protein YgaE (UPF0421/DUF939 family)
VIGPALSEARGRLRARGRALRTSAILIVQTAVAAGVAWVIAQDLIGHGNAFFAPIAAVIVLGIAPGGHRRRAAEVAVGVAVGIGVADLLIRLIGTGAVQISVVVLLAAAAVVLLGGGPLVAAQAASSAVLVATLPTKGAVPYRFIDALVGGLVGLAVLIAVPRNPLTALRGAVDPLLAELGAVLDDIADALEERAAAAAGRVLERARAMTGLADAFHSTLDGARETALLAPTRWRNQEDVERYARAARHVDYAVRNVRVLARSARTALEAGDEIPPGIADAIRLLAMGVHGLERELAKESGGIAAIEAILKAAGRATRALDRRPSLAVNVMIGQVRSIAADLLGALGIERQEAVRHIRAAVRQLR